MKSKIIINIAFLLFCSGFTQSQTYDTINVKEDFDFYSDYLVFNNYKLCTIHPDKDWNTFGDGVIKVLDGYIDVYLATKDKSYLYKFVHQSLCIIENRNDINPEATTKTPKWTETTSSTYVDGYIIGTFSRFVHLVKILQPELMDMELYQFLEIDPEFYQSNTCNCNYTGQKFKTLGEYVQWLEARTIETLDYFVYRGFWDNGKGVTQTGGELVINMQTGFARCLLYTGLSTQNSDYLRMADTIASLYKSQVRFNDRCSKERYDFPVLRYNSKNNSYWWYHSGWSLSYRECGRSLFFKVPNFNAFTEYIEDVNHGTIVMIFPYEYYKFGKGKFFNETDMIRFKNTFKNNIYDNGKYNVGVDGSSGKTYTEAKYKPEQIVSMRETCAIGFSNWADFDTTSTTNSVYEIIMNDYIKLFASKPTVPPYYSGQKCMGHGQLVVQQWKLEKPDLTLFNRDMVYDQDFFAKGSIIVDPEYNRPAINKTSQPNAFPKEFIDSGSYNRFVIEPGVIVNFTAGESIKFKKGFHLKKGAELKAKLSDTDKSE
ncbi:MAG TPA: hypothetical protein PLL66_04330 [Bacteroidales bacterium]|nr:hypothetical protein [Bacteroidales bacterium]